jgi:hypothetical protein
MKRKSLLAVCGLAAFVWLAIFCFKYYTLNRGCWFPVLSLHSGGYICTDPPRAQTSSSSANELAALTVTSVQIILFAALSATTNTIVVAFSAAVVGVVAMAGAKALRKPHSHR